MRRREKKIYKRPWRLRSQLDDYKIEKQIGEGVYGKVHRALDKNEKKSEEKIVALKKIKTDAGSEKEGFAITALREIQILLELQNPNIVLLKDVAIRNEHDVFLVFEYLDHDLNGLIEEKNPAVTKEHYRSYMKQLFSGVAFMHDRSILHRDIKASNLLVSNSNQLKIGDWGLARKIFMHKNNLTAYMKSSCVEDDMIQYTNRVITLWYRPPELLLGATTIDTGYGAPADIWSIGCILAELYHGKPILPGQTETEQLDLIFGLLGPPNPIIWPTIHKLPLFEAFCLDTDLPINDSIHDSNSNQDDSDNAMGSQKGIEENTFSHNGDLPLREEDDDDDLDDDISRRRRQSYSTFKKQRNLRDRFRNFDKDALDLVDQVLVYDPATRITARSALISPYLSKAKDPSQLPTLNIESSHEWEVRNKRRKIAAAVPSTNNNTVVSIVANNNINMQQQQQNTTTPMNFPKAKPASSLSSSSRHR